MPETPSFETNPDSQGKDASKNKRLRQMLRMTLVGLAITPIAADGLARATETHDRGEAAAEALQKAPKAFETLQQAASSRTEVLDPEEISGLGHLVADQPGAGVYELKAAEAAEWEAAHPYDAVQSPVLALAGKVELTHQHSVEQLSAIGPDGKPLFTTPEGTDVDRPVALNNPIVVVGEKGLEFFAHDGGKVMRYEVKFGDIVADAADGAFTSVGEQAVAHDRVAAVRVNGRDVEISTMADRESGAPGETVSKLVEVAGDGLLSIDGVAADGATAQYPDAIRAATTDSWQIGKNTAGENVYLDGGASVQSTG